MGRARVILSTDVPHCASAPYPCPCPLHSYFLCSYFRADILADPEPVNFAEFWLLLSTVSSKTNTVTKGIIHLHFQESNAQGVVSTLLS